MKLEKNAEMPMEIDVESSQASGEALFDPKAGRFTEISQTQKMTVKVKQGAGGMPVVSTTESKTKVTFK